MVFSRQTCNINALLVLIVGVIKDQSAYFSLYWMVQNIKLFNGCEPEFLYLHLFY